MDLHLKVMMYSVLRHRETVCKGVYVSWECDRRHQYARHAVAHLNSLYGTCFSASMKLLTHAGVGLTSGTGCKLCNWLAPTRPVWAH